MENPSGALVAALRAVRREDLLLVVGYPALMWLLATVDGSGGGWSAVPPEVVAWWPAVAVAGSLAIALRRSAPFAMAAGTGTAGIVLLLMGQTSCLLLFWETAFSLVLFAGDRASRATEIGALALTAAASVVVLAATGDLRQAVLAALLLGLTLLLPVEWASNLRKERRLAAAEAARASAVEETARQRATIEAGRHELAIATERQRMAHELHDVLSARLSAIALQTGAALSTGSPGQAAEVLAHVRAESVAGLGELASMIRLLSAGEAEESAGSLGDLDALVAAHVAAGLQITTSNMVTGMEAIPLPVHTAAYRIVAEALVNALRHAPGAAIAVELEGGPGTGLLRASITNGRPGAAAPHPALPEALAPSGGGGTGTGLTSLRLRAEALGGTLEAGWFDGGWRVVARLPVPAADPGSGGVDRHPGERTAGGTLLRGGRA
ncbi:sensor histidine kinase [Arthrobacter sp. JSM 101049]|uniref:sensor histidine kinase n=1 Tax=Arthrobacter sp. JSM 101049 TaxID=929097 RepID=UPI00356902B4